MPPAPGVGDKANRPDDSYGKKCRGHNNALSDNILELGISPQNTPAIDRVLNAA